MDISTIKVLIKIAKANLKVARKEFDLIKNNPNARPEWDWEDALADAGRETYACEEVVRFLTANLENVSYIETKTNKQK